MFSSLLKSSETLIPTNEIVSWIEERNRNVNVDVKRVVFSDMAKWQLDRNIGMLKHESGKFFSIQGIHVDTDYGCKHSWDQPIINQPEIGYLGILAKEFDGVMYFLMQAKIEPGNVNCVQISPTLQATKSNYTQVHEGKKPTYLEYFANAKPHQIILDQLQSEQGARFLRKRNRNIIIKVDDEVMVGDDFRWMTLGQIKDLMRYDNVVNMDTRTVLSGIDFCQYDIPHCYTGYESLHTMTEHLSWLSNLKSKYELNITSKRLDELEEWQVVDDEISRYDEAFFKVIGVNVTISNREVTSWCQPLVQPMQQGICAFIVKKINGVYHFLMQAKLECGNYDIIELAPTVQCLTGNVYAVKNKPAYTDYVLNAPKNKVLYDVMQSEEGGRFYHEQNRNMIVEADDTFSEEELPNFHWMTLRQIGEFLKFNNYLNIQARSLISAIKYDI